MSPAKSQPPHWARLAGKKLPRTGWSWLAETAVERPLLCKNRVLVKSTGEVVVASERLPPGALLRGAHEVEASPSVTGNTGPRMQLKERSPAKQSHEIAVAGSGTIRTRHCAFKT